MGASVCNMKTDSQGREITEHGSVLFPAAFYADDLIAETITWHWHDDLELIIVEEGEVIVAAGTEKYTLEQGEGFFINSGVLHTVLEGKTEISRIRSVVFHPRLVGGSIDSIFWQNYVQPVVSSPVLKQVCLSGSKTWHQEAVELIRAAWECGVKEELGYELRVREVLSRFLFLMTTHQPSAQKNLSEKAVRDGERIKIMLQYVQENYSGEINTAQIAGSAMISESECLRCFRNTIGTTPIQYVKQFRIQKATELIEDTQLKIAEIGELCGFQEMSYFAKTFWEIKGCTPSEYRRVGQ